MTYTTRISANALIVDANISEYGKGINGIFSLGGDALALWIISRLMGGLWVGGFVELQENQLTFEPNELNDLLTTGSLRVSIPLQNIEKVTWRFGLITGIIDISTTGQLNSVFSIRCKDSKNVVLTIRGAILRNS